MDFTPTLLSLHWMALGTTMRGRGRVVRKLAPAIANAMAAPGMKGEHQALE